MTEQKQQELCENCRSKLAGDYCSNCGQPKQLRRIDGGYIFSEIGSVLNFDKGILYTIKELVIRPGQSVQDFIHKERNRLVKPIIFIILCSLIYSIAQRLLHFEDGYVQGGGFGESTTALIFQWVQSNYGYANIIMALFIGMWIRLIFRKYKYNYFEILILLCFAMSIGMLIYTVFGIVDSLTGARVLNFGGLFGFVYISWAIGSFFDKRKIMNYVKALFSYILGMITFSFVALGVGALIDLLKNM